MAAVVVAALVLGIHSAAAGPSATTTLSPTTATFTLAAGESAKETKTVTVPARPPKVDVELAIDTTGSMSPAINQAKTDAAAIVSGVQGSVPDTQFAVVQFKDQGDFPEYRVEQSMTANPSVIAGAVNGLSPAGGGDSPEAYNLVFRNSYEPDLGGDIGWRDGTRKFVVVIGDAQPHGPLASRGLGPCIDASADPHGFDTKDELDNMKSRKRTLLMLRQASPSSTTLGCYEKLATAAYPTGKGENAASGGAGVLATQIVNLANAAFGTVATLQLGVVSASPAPAASSWISFSPSTLTNLTPLPTTQTFTVDISVPSGTPAGTYTFDIRAVADGADIGHQTLTIIVTPPPGDLCIQKFSDKNGNAVRDAGEALLSGWTFTISDAGGASRTVVTSASGPACAKSLPVGSYDVKETIKPGWQPTVPASGAGSATVVSSQTRNFLVGNHRFLVNHFECYDVKPTVFPRKYPKLNVRLHDQFGTYTARALRRLRLCNPVDKNKERAGDTRGHLVCYSLDRRRPSGAKLDVFNQFGNVALTVQPSTPQRPIALCVPSSKAKLPAKLTSAGKLDHYVCYRASQRPPFRPTRVGLKDQFWSSTAIVVTPVAICNPVDKRYKRKTTLARNRVDHLVCYSIRPITRVRRFPAVVIRNQFEKFKPLRAVTPKELCVPSLKKLVSQAPGG